MRRAPRFLNSFCITSIRKSSAHWHTMTKRYLVRVIRWRNTALAGATAIAILAMCLSAAPDPLADLKAGATALDGKRYAAAIALLEPLGKKLPKLADYAAWMLASSQFGLKNYASVPK